MYKYKEDFLKFLVWMRNGTAFCTTWFLILMLVYNSFFNIPAISTNILIKLILLSFGGTFLFIFFLHVCSLKSGVLLKD